MTDQQLKIRIKLQQPQSSIEQHSPEFTEPEETEKPPFDWLKISLALLILSCILGILFFSLFSQNENEPNQSSRNDTQATIEPIIATEEDSLQLPDHSLNLIEDETLIEDNTNSPMQPDMAILGTPDHKPVAESINHPVPSSKPTRLPEENNATKLHSHTEPLLDDASQVIRAQLSHGIQDREPIDSINHIQLDQDPNKAIYFFTQISGLAGQSVEVGWHHEDQLRTTTKLKIGADDWRTNASKLLTQNSLGVWRVILSDQSGNQLAERVFTVSNEHENQH